MNTNGLLHTFVQKWLAWDLVLKKVGNYGLVYEYIIFI